MSRWASPFVKVSQPDEGRQTGFVSLSGFGRLPLLFILAVSLTFVLAAGNVTAAMLFQSPQSPPAQPPPEQPPPEQPPPAQPTATQPPAEQPPAGPPPAEQSSGGQAPPEQAPAEQPPVEQPPTEQPAAEQPAAEPAAPVESPVGEASAPEEPLLEPEAPVPEPIKPGEDIAPFETAEGQSRLFTLDQVELIDTVVVSGAYIWLCCGVMLLLLAPLFLLLLHIRGRGKIIQEEGF